MKTLLCFLIIVISHMYDVNAQNVVSGTVYGIDKQPLTGAAVSIKGTSQGTFTDAEGKFSIYYSDSSAILTVSYLGYKAKEVRVSTDHLLLELESISTDLQEVLVSTGYQNLSAERTTGSFSTVNETQLNRRVSRDILSRIADLVPGLVFH